MVRLPRWELFVVAEAKGNGRRRLAACMVCGAVFLDETADDFLEAHEKTCPEPSDEEE
jgi:hypothetical protein